MSSDALDKLIDQLEEMMPSDPGLFGIGVERHDWKVFWDFAKEIQAGFNSGVRYPSKQLRQDAWNRFNGLRSEGSRRGNSERMHLAARSKQHRDNLFSKCSGIGWSAFLDDLFFFDQTTVEEMKTRGRYLSEAMKYLSEHKHEMLGDDKRICYERIQEVKEEHERFWAQYRRSKELRRSERAERCRANLERNRDKYRRTADALERFRDKAEELRDKISSSTSDKWIEIWSGWLSETEAKIDDIESQLRRIDEWIEEDEKRLAELGG
jgi:predicted RNase H-like nuclease (RuvC/YqgF family)